MSIKIQREDVASMEAATGLFLSHWNEVGVNKDNIKLSPDWDTYYNAEEAGNLLVIVARDNGNIVGYFVVFVSAHPHYKEHLFASNDIIFIIKELRSTGLGKKMIDCAEKELKAMGCSVLCINTKVTHPFDNLLTSSGYSLTERVYTKYIGS